MNYHNAVTGWKRTLLGYRSATPDCCTHSVISSPLSPFFRTDNGKLLWCFRLLMSFSQVMVVSYALLLLLLPGMQAQSTQFTVSRQGRNSFVAMLWLIFLAALRSTDGQSTASYALFDPNVARPLAFSMKIHPPEVPSSPSYFDRSTFWRYRNRYYLIVGDHSCAKS